MSIRSVLSIGRTTCVSGSPKRELYSTTFIPLFVRIRPKYRQPLNVLPSAFIAFIVGIIMVFITSSSSSLVQKGQGEKVPIPPVLRPLSPSSARLWSHEVIIGTIVLPSVKESTDTSSPGVYLRPRIHSSITILLPAEPKALSSIMLFKPSSASSSVLHTSTPLPRARPSAFKTMGAPFSRR